MIALCFTLSSLNAQASTPATMALTNIAGDTVQVNITGENNSSIRLSFLPPGASSVTTIVFGTTDSNGEFSTSISSGGYGIPAGSPAFITINGVQSSTALWPSYSSTISLDQTSTQIAVGQSVTITSSNTLILSLNSLATSIGTAISGSQITVTGLSLGTGTLTLCGANVGCESVAVVVGEKTGQTQISLSQNTATLDYMESKNITIFGGSNNGYTIELNSNTSSVYASISGSSNVISLFGESEGTATIKVCSAESDTNCINLYVTVLSDIADILSFSQNNLSLIPGLSQSATISGGSSSNYYIFSNTDSSVATVTISGSTITVVGGSNTGSTVIKVCSATLDATCSNLYVTTNADTTTPSSTVLAFSQNVVSVAKEDTTNVTVSGGGGSGYAISSNSNSSAVTASINSGSNIISFYGSEEGSAIVEVCSVSANTVCASVYVNVGPALVPITFSDNNISLTTDQRVIVTISGGTDDNVIYSISNPNAVSASLTNNGNTIVLIGGTAAGSSVIRVCDEAESSNCSDLTAELIAPATTTDNTSNTTKDTTSPATPATDQLQQISIDASAVYSENINNILENVGNVRDENKETDTSSKYLNSLTLDEESLSSPELNRLNFFITYGTQSTKILGAGERAGVIGSYKKAFGKLPKTEAGWSDAVKIANGRWPAETSQTALDLAKTEFNKVYKRDANMNNPNDNAAVSVIAYGLRPSNRNMDSEKAAIKTFKSIYGHNPISSQAWDIVRAIAYSGAIR